MESFRRRLPHQYPEGKWLFVTWHLHGSLPSRFRPPDKLTHGKAFVWMDRYLDTTRKGPMFLKEPKIATAIVRSLHQGVACGHYELRCWVLMGNHVHALLFPRVSPSHLMKSLKGATAREANRILDRIGQPFWQAESYDHWVRDEAEFNRIVRYIETNPVRAGLVARPEDYIWSSAHEVLKLVPTAPATSAGSI
jgi:REP element-mobilizing transposase RayT